MTAQISDRVMYRQEAFGLVGVKGHGLFAPEDHGIKPVATSTACWRGFHCLYEVCDDRLILRTVDIGLDEECTRTAEQGGGPMLLGHAPQARYVEGAVRDPKTNKLRRGQIAVGWMYELSAPISFTGGLLLGSEFIRELYVHMGFHPAWKYRHVHELLFENGRLTRASDRSAEMAEFRKDMEERQLQPGYEANQDEIRQWIEKCFSLDYRLRQAAE